MYQARKDSVRFSVKVDGQVQRVSLVGDFNGWKPLAMKKQKDGAFVRLVPRPKGNFQYKFIVEDNWITDPDNRHVVPNAFGTLNSVGSL